MTLALFEVNCSEIPDSSTCKKSLQVAAAEVGMIAPGELGPSLILSIRETEYRHSGKPCRSILYRLVDGGHEYRRLNSLDEVIHTAEDAPFRRWMEHA